MFRYSTILLLVFLIPLISFSKKTVNIDSLSVKVISTPDTIYFKAVNSNSVAASIKSEADASKTAAWIVALFVGISTVIVNLIVNWFTRKSNDKILKIQLQSNKEALDLQLKNSKEALLMQLETSKDIALEQIKNAQINSQRDFNKTVLSGNRQAWINDLRTNISKILECAHYFSLGTAGDKEYNQMKYLVIHTGLMLNPDKDKDFILSLEQLVDCSLGAYSKKKSIEDVNRVIERVKIYAQNTLKTEWERVKRGE